MHSIFRYFCSYRTVFFPIILALFVLKSDAQEGILASSDIADLTGPVQSVRIEESWYIDRDGERVPDRRILSSTCEYSTSRLLKGRYFFDSNGKPTDRWLREWDDRGRVVLEVKYKGDDRLIARSEYKYDEKGNRSETLKFRYDGVLIQHLHHKYDEKNQLIESLDVREDRLKQRTVYTYDERGNRSSFSDYEPDGTMKVREEFLYDDKGNLLQSSLYNQANDLMGIMTSFYDEKGNRIETISHSRGGRVDSHRIYRYDERRNVVDQFTYGRDDKFMDREVYSYEYDDRGNWIVKYESSARPESNYRLPQRIVYRSFHYFDELPSANQSGQ